MGMATPRRTKSTERSRQVIENNRWLFVAVAAPPSRDPVGTGWRVGVARLGP